MSDIPKLDYWVQQVFPAVYDDTLSHYELLAKVIDHLNEMGVQTNELTGIVNNLMSQGFDVVVNWGDILGNISNQVDLKNVLDGKASTQKATPLVDGLMSKEDKGKLDTLHNNLATHTTAGFMSAPDKTKLDNLVVGGGGGGESEPATWGGITGDINLQADLQTALDGKANIVDPTFMGTATFTGQVHGGNIISSDGGFVQAGDYLEDLFAPITHGHAISDVTGLQSALDSKAGTTLATTSLNGLMSSSDKTKLDTLSVASGNNPYPAIANFFGSQTISSTSALYTVCDVTKKGLLYKAISHGGDYTYAKMIITINGVIVFNYTNSADSSFGIFNPSEVLSIGTNNYGAIATGIAFPRAIYKDGLSYVPFPSPSTNSFSSNPLIPIYEPIPFDSIKIQVANTSNLQSVHYGIMLKTE